MKMTKTVVRPLILVAADLIEAAALHMETYGHHKKDFRANGADAFELPACTVGAIRLSAGVDPNGPTSADHPIDNAAAIIAEAEQIVAEWLIEHGNAERFVADGDDDLDCMEVIGTWNDDDAMTGEEAALTLREIAAAARTYPSAQSDDNDYVLAA